MTTRAAQAARMLAAVSILATLSGASDSRAGQDAASTTTHYVSPVGSDRARCTLSAPCASFRRAYAVASPGDVVEVAAGTYGPQTIDADASKSGTERISFRPAEGATVTINGEFNAGNNKTGAGPKRFELEDFTITGAVRISWGTEDVVLRNIDAGVLNLTSTKRVQVYGGDFGPWVDGISHIKSCLEPGCFAAEDILIDGAVFHDYTIRDPAKHSECLMIWPGRRVTIRNSTFRNCTDFGVLVKPYKTGLAGPPQDITFENNFFDTPMVGDKATIECTPNCPRAGNAIAITDGDGETWSGVQIRYNSTSGGIRIDRSVSGVVVKGNVAQKEQSFSCFPSITFSFNVWSGARCSPSDRTAALSTVFMNASSPDFDFRLRADSPAIGAGDPIDHPARDKAGRLRPATFAPDAGAWQREPALVVEGQRIGTAAIGARRAALTEFYGRPRKVTSEKHPDGTRLPVDVYRVRGGPLRVTYKGERAVAIATTSPYYRTSRGLGPGVPVPRRADRVASCWPIGAPGRSARLFIRATAANKPVVAELVVVARRYTPICAKPKPKPKPR